MRVVKSLQTEEVSEDVKYIYKYTILEKNFEGTKAYGIEVERNDIYNGKEIERKRDSIDIISTNLCKVESMLDLLFENKVSPIHLVDVLGEYVDKCAYEF